MEVSGLLNRGSMIVNVPEYMEVWTNRELLQCCQHIDVAKEGKHNKEMRPKRFFKANYIQNKVISIYNRIVFSLMYGVFFFCFFENLFFRAILWKGLLIHCLPLHIHCSCCSVAKSFPAFCNPIDWNIPGFPVLHHLSKFSQTHVHWLSDVI